MTKDRVDHKPTVFVSVVSITHSCKACEPNIITDWSTHNTGNDSQSQPGFQRVKVSSCAKSSSGTLESREEAFEGFGVLRSSYRIFGRPWSSRNKVSSHVTDFNTRNQILTAKLFKQGYRYHKLRKTFSKFYRRRYDLVSKFNTGLKSLLKQAYRNLNFKAT